MGDLQRDFVHGTVNSLRAKKFIHGNHHIKSRCRPDHQMVQHTVRDYVRIMGLIFAEKINANDYGTTLSCQSDNDPIGMLTLRADPYRISLLLRSSRPSGSSICHSSDCRNNNKHIRIRNKPQEFVHSEKTAENRCAIVTIPILAPNFSSNEPPRRF